MVIHNIIAAVNVDTFIDCFGKHLMDQFLKILNWIICVAIQVA